VNLSGKRQDEEIAQSERSMDPKNLQLGYSESQISKSNYFVRNSAFHSYTKRPVSFKASSRRYKIRNDSAFEFSAFGRSVKETEFRLRTVPAKGPKQVRQVLCSHC
jgi:hypothetical protein